MNIVAKLGLKAKNRDEAVTDLFELLNEKGYVKNTYLKNVLEREKIYPTGLRLPGGIDVALPHGDAEHINKMSLAVGVLEKPVKFNQMGTNPKDEDAVDAKIVFLLAVSEPKKLVPYLKKLTDDIFQKPNVIEAINNAKNESEVVSIVQSAIVGATNLS